MYLEIVTNRQALKLRKLGFDYDTALFYDYDGFLRDKDTGLPAPTQALALQWMREKFPEYPAGIMPNIKGFTIFYYPKLFRHNTNPVEEVSGNKTADYIQAESELLDMLLSIVGVER